jgi:hypothetical protein
LHSSQSGRILQLMNATNGKPHFKLFPDWLSARLGTKQWVVVKGGKLTEENRAKGFTVAISDSRFCALAREFHSGANP